MKIFENQKLCIPAGIRFINDPDQAFDKSVETIAIGKYIEASGAG